MKKPIIFDGRNLYNKSAILYLDEILKKMF